MSTLVTIQGTDLPTNSRANINDNFSALNSEKLETSVLDTDTTLAANSDSKVATQKAVKAYVDAGGNVNASTTTKGIVELATQAELDAGTATGATGAALVVTPDIISGSIGSSKKSMVAGATINGATLPVPVYQNKTDNEFYACDANDTAAMKFLGFAISNGVDGGSMTVQFSGIVGGFTALTEGEKYYVQDAVGTIGNTIGTYEILVGVAISETELLIQKGKRYSIGGNSYGDIGSNGQTSDNVITCGFRPSKIEVICVTEDNAASDSTHAVASLFYANNTSSLINSGVVHTPSVLNITDTGFTVRVTQVGNNTAGYTTYINWCAEGEL